MLQAVVSNPIEGARSGDHSAGGGRTRHGSGGSARHLLETSFNPRAPDTPSPRAENVSATCRARRASRRARFRDARTNVPLTKIRHRRSSGITRIPQIGPGGDAYAPHRSPERRRTRIDHGPRARSTAGGGGGGACGRSDAPAVICRQRGPSECGVARPPGGFSASRRETRGDRRRDLRGHSAGSTGFVTAPEPRRDAVSICDARIAVSAIPEESRHLGITPGLPDHGTIARQTSADQV